MSIRKKLTLFILMVSIVPLLIMGIFSFTIARRNLLEREKRNMRDYLSQAIQGMENTIDIYNNLSDYIAYNQTISNVIGYKYESSEYNSSFEVYKELRDVVDPLLSGVKYFNQDMEGLTMYVDSDIIKHDTTIAPLSEVKDARWYGTMREKTDSEIYWFVEEASQKVYLVRNMPLLEDKDSSGYLYIEVEYSSIFDIFSRMESDKYGVVVFDENGNEVYNYNSFSDRSHVVASKAILDGIMPLEVTTSSYNLTYNDTNYTLVKLVTDQDWTAVIYKPNSVINQSISSFISIVIVFSLLCIAASAIVGSFVSRKVVGIIGDMTENMKEVEAGNYEVTVKYDSKDEVGSLIRGFERMTDRINTLINEVYKGKLSQKEAEMKALQAQINPHFLYNSLSLINWKAIEAKQPDISRITLLLSKFYRTSLNKGKNITSIKDEISNIQSYIDIQLMMHDNEFDIKYDLSPDIMEYSIPNLMLQPLIENAIDHGIDIKTDGRGVIEIAGQMEGEDMIRLTVSDNGVGMSEEMAQQIISEGSRGYGVKNVNDRIKHFYGEEYGITVESEEGKGTRIIILIPAVPM